MAGHGRHYILETPAGERVLAHPRGKRSDCVVGDEVRWQRVSGGSERPEGVIESIEPRRNLLYRQDEWRTKSFAANLDQVLYVLSGHPMFGESQLCRALIAAEDARIPVTLILTKTDLPQAAEAQQRLAPYAAMGLAIVTVSATTDIAGTHSQLMDLTQGLTSLMLGPSGSGKSTLINLLAPQAEAAVGEISEALRAGRHTTTRTTLYRIEDATALIDSPGFQEFGLHHIDPARLASLMPDLAPHVRGCRFSNCTHRQEPGCAVQAAVGAGQVSARRHAIYLDLHEELSRSRW